MNTKPTIENLFTEWAMQSPDGLSANALSLENIGALKKSMKTFGFSDKNISEVVTNLLVNQPN